MGSSYAVAAVWIGLASPSEVIAARVGMAASLVEILAGRHWRRTLSIGLASFLLPCASRRSDL